VPYRKASARLLVLCFYAPPHTPTTTPPESRRSRQSTGEYLPSASKCSCFHLVCIANLLSCAGGPRYLAFFLRYCFRLNAAGPSVCRAVAEGPSGTAGSRVAPGRRSLEGPPPREGAWMLWRKMRSALAMKSPDFCLFRSGGCDHAIARLGFSTGCPSRFG
jgi:hypothetical protein